MLLYYLYRAREWLLNGVMYLNICKHIVNKQFSLYEQFIVLRGLPREWIRADDYVSLPQRILLSGLFGRENGGIVLHLFWSQAQNDKVGPRKAIILDSVSIYLFKKRNDFSGIIYLDTTQTDVFSHQINSATLDTGRWSYCCFRNGQICFNIWTNFICYRLDWVTARGVRSQRIHCYS